MSEAGKRLIEGAKEALEIARGNQPAARIHVNGHAYVPENRWQPIDTAPRDGTSFQAWVVREDTDFGFWEPRARFNPDCEAFEIWGRTDYDQEGWDVYIHVSPTHWMPEPAAPPGDTP